MRKLVVLVVLIILANNASAQAPRFRERLDSFMTALDKNNKSMCAVAVTKGGKLIYNKAIGYANESPGWNIKADTNTRYGIGSITKMFTAVMIFQLVEEHKITLATHLDAFFPGVPNAKEITIAQMLSHHSGIYSFTSDSTFEAWQYLPQTKAAMLKRISAFAPAFAPGSKAEYSNTNFVLLAYIVEQLTGMPYGKALQKRIIQKLHLTHTANGNNEPSQLALSYTRNDDKWEIEKTTDPSISTGAGSIVSSAADLDRFINALFAGKLVSRASLEQMMTVKDGYGMGMFTVPFNEHKGYGHSGHIDAFTSSLGYFPADSVAFAVIVNGQNYPLNDIAIGVLSTYYGVPFKIPDFKTVAVSAKVLEAYQGEYTNPDMPLSITISVKGGTLFAQGTGQQAFPLEAEGPATFTFKAARIGIDFPSAGKLILHQGGANITFTRK